MEDKLKYVLNALILAHLGVGSLGTTTLPAQIKPALLLGALTVHRGALQRPNKKAPEMLLMLLWRSWRVPPPRPPVYLG